MIIKTLAVGPLEANCYIVADGENKEAFVVDPGDEPDRIADVIEDMGLKVKYIVLTHAHFDHVGAVPDIKKETGAPVAVHEDELPLYDSIKDQAAFWGYEAEPLPPPDALLKEGAELKIGSLSFKVLHTPGHSPGGICLFGNGIIFTGDTLFQGSVGRTDFYGGDMEKLKSSFKRLLSLPPSTRVFPGHGPSTTIEIELKENLFVEEFD